MSVPNGWRYTSRTLPDEIQEGEMRMRIAAEELKFQAERAEQNGFFNLSGHLERLFVSRRFAPGKPNWSSAES
jgi:hypothetical protein